MAIEAKRGCGYRKAGGLYVVGEFENPQPAPWLPFCTSHAQTRSLQWVSGADLFATADGMSAEERASWIVQRAGETASDGGTASVALMWVGAKHYSPSSFTAEALTMGVSKRVSSIPKDLRPGDPVALAHPSAIPVRTVSGVVSAMELTASAGRGFELSAGHYLPRTTHCARCRYVPAAKAIANAGIGTVRGMFKAYLHTLESFRSKGPLVYADARYVHALTAERQCGSTAAHIAQVQATLNGITGYADPLQVAGVFSLFRMRQVEVVLPASIAGRSDIVSKCAARGVRIVAVPDDDPDHVPANWKLPKFLSGDDELTLPLDGDGDAKGADDDATV